MNSQNAHETADWSDKIIRIWVIVLSKYIKVYISNITYISAKVSNFPTNLYVHRTIVNLIILKNSQLDI